jgi:hypothetical protein
VILEKGGNEIRLPLVVHRTYFCVPLSGLTDTAWAEIVVRLLSDRRRMLIIVRL